MSNIEGCPVCGKIDLSHPAHTFRCHEIELLWNERDALQAKLDITVEALLWIKELFVSNGEYNEATEKVDETFRLLGLSANTESMELNET